MKEKHKTTTMFHQVDQITFENKKNLLNTRKLPCTTKCILVWSCINANIKNIFRVVKLWCSNKMLTMLHYISYKRRKASYSNKWFNKHNSHSEMYTHSFINLNKTKNQQKAQQNVRVEHDSGIITILHVIIVIIFYCYRFTHRRL